MRRQEVRRENNFEEVLCEEVPVRISPAPQTHEDRGGGEGARAPTSLLLVELLQKLLLPLDVLEQTQELRLFVLRQVPELLAAEHQLLPHVLLSALSLLELLTEPLKLGLKAKDIHVYLVRSKLRVQKTTTYLESQKSNTTIIPKNKDKLKHNLNLLFV